MRKPMADRWLSANGELLRQRIGYLHYYTDVDRLVDGLRLIYREYKHQKREVFAERVRLLLPSCKVRSRFMGMPRRIRNELDESQEKLPNKSSSITFPRSVEPSFSSRVHAWAESGKWGGVEGNRQVSGKIVNLENQKGGDGVEFGAFPKFKALGRMSEVIWKLIEDFVTPLYRPEELRHLGLEPMTGILLHGPPGCGKTKLAHVIAHEARLPFYKISAADLLLSGVSGASEEKIRELFAKASKTAPSIIFIDEIDVIASNTEEISSRQIVTQLRTCMDESKPVNRNADTERCSSRPGYILVIGATNRPDANLRSLGRFDYEIGLGLPDEEAQVQILTVLTHSLRVEGVIDLTYVARSTPGYVGADLAALAKKDGSLVIKSIRNHRKDVLSGEDLSRHPQPREEVEKVGMSTTDFEMHEATTDAMKDIWASRHEISVDYSTDEHFKRALGTIFNSVPAEVVSMQQGE